jgi:molybdate transport system substrate-binding protein
MLVQIMNSKAGEAPLRVMCARALTAVVTTISAEFKEISGHDVELVLGPVGTLQKKIDLGETGDVLILAAPAIERLEKSGKVLAGTCRAVGSTGIGVAVREGAERPDISSADAFKTALLKAHSIALSDPSIGGSAGTYLVGLFDQLGVTEVVKTKALLQQGGGEVARRVAEGTAEMGLTQVSEMVAVAGITIVGALPAPIGNETMYVAAVYSGSDRAGVARGFIARLRTPEARQLLMASGLSPAHHG